MKKSLAILFSFLLIFTIALPVQAASSTNATVYYNGEKLALTEAPFIEKGKTYIPLRSYFKELGYNVSYSDKQKTIIVSYEGFKSTIDLKTNKVSEYGEVIVDKLDVIQRNYTTYAPLRELQPITLLNMEWKKESNSIYLTDMYPATDVETLEAQLASQGFLWKTVHNGNTVYLLGSIHVGDEALYPLRTEINEAFAASDVVVTEVDTKKELT
ncbi:MAG TPA: TraB/GumN family protein, partial [Candidatus Paenibacillus intestinavium]|nr:TraB/GumN family protein [Candidatus Paenibacillus intestinavium]